LSRDLAVQSRRIKTADAFDAADSITGVFPELLLVTPNPVKTTRLDIMVYPENPFLLLFYRFYHTAFAPDTPKSTGLREPPKGLWH